MTAFSDYSPWGRATALWLWTNLGGVLGIFLTLMLTDKHYSPAVDLRIPVTIGLIAGPVSLPVILLAYPVFCLLLPIKTRSARLFATAGAISAAFVVTLLLAITAVDGGVQPGRAFGLGGWAYLLAALVASARVYSPALLRPDDSTAPDDAA